MSCAGSVGRKSNACRAAPLSSSIGWTGGRPAVRRRPEALNAARLTTSGGALTARPMRCPTRRSASASGYQPAPVTSDSCIRPTSPSAVVEAYPKRTRWKWPGSSFSGRAGTLPYSTYTGACETQATVPGSIPVSSASSRSAAPASVTSAGSRWPPGCNMIPYGRCSTSRDLGPADQQCASGHVHREVPPRGEIPSLRQQPQGLR